MEITDPHLVARYSERIEELSDCFEANMADTFGNLYCPEDLREVFRNLEIELGEKKVEMIREKM